jgi:hypothetical protein
MRPPIASMFPFPIPRVATARGIRDARHYPDALCLRTIDVEPDIFGIVSSLHSF